MTTVETPKNELLRDVKAENLAPPPRGKRLLSARAERMLSARVQSIPIPTLYDPILSRREFHSAKGNDFRGAHEVFALISSSRHLVRFAARHKIIRNLESFGSIDSNDPLITAAVPAMSATRCTKSRQP